MDDDNKRNSEPTKINSTVWFLLFILGFLALCLVMILQQNKKELKYDDFTKLMKISTFDESGRTLVEGTEESSSITVKEGSTKGRTTEYRKPFELVIGEKLIEGRIQYRSIEKDNADAEFKTAMFTCNKDNADSTNEALTALLSKSNVSWTYDSGPSPWEKYSFFLITMGLIIGLFYFMMLG